MLSLWAGSIDAELVIMTDGHYVRVDSFVIEDDRIELSLLSGGILEMSLLRVERIVDDAIESESSADDRDADFDPRASDVPLASNTPFAGLIIKHAERRSLNPRLVAAVIAAESAFDVDAISSRGANGLMQLMPATAARFGLEFDDILDPDRNIGVGSRYLAWLLDRFENRLDLALAGYNAGEGTVDRYRGVPPFKETRGYIQRIFESLGIDRDSTAKPRLE